MFKTCMISPFGCTAGETETSVRSGQPREKVRHSEHPDERHGETCGMSCAEQLLRIGTGAFAVAAEEGVGIAFERLTLGRNRTLAFAPAAGPGSASETSHDSWL